ncbi:MAG: protein-L-isoaspartate(D-aspartate) O-methyltransferase [Clostridia bacterium]|nr:protein-L-isoaspartate(D-aspartate) O-methyltransferase [Clostridia bacterium]
MDTNHFTELREKMVSHQIQSRGIVDENVLEAMRKVPRHLFVPEGLIDLAYLDCALPSTNGQTISQPYIVAYMTEKLHLKPSDRVLEIGTGTGYQTAILSEISNFIVTMERIPDLHQSAKIRLEKLDYKNITCIYGNGYEGFIPGAPYDKIIVTAAAPFIPESLVLQLSPNGRMIIPVGTSSQELVIVTKDELGEITKKNDLSVVFVPLLEK